MITVNALFQVYFILLGLIFSGLVCAYAAHCSWMRSARHDQLMIIDGRLYQVRLKYRRPVANNQQHHATKESTMLKLSQSAGNVITVTHQESGETLDIITLGVRSGEAKLGFEDPAHKFHILRENAIKKTKVSHVKSAG